MIGGWAWKQRRSVTNECETADEAISQYSGPVYDTVKTAVDLEAAAAESIAADVEVLVQEPAKPYFDITLKEMPSGQLSMF
jgi:hypothetical protein